MATVKDSATFFQHGNSAQFEYVLALYPKALRLKADARGVGKKADKLIRLEEWYQNELPKLIKKRGRDAHLQHEELVQTMEWKQTRGKFYPQLSYLIKVNTPRAVVMETKKAFRKLPNLEQALNALSNLKGVGITMASALLAAAIPESAPFMADECLMAIPDFEGIDYTTKEYLKFVTHIQQTMDRLNAEVEGTNSTAGSTSSSTGSSNGNVANAADAADSTEKDRKSEDSKEKEDEDEEEGGGGTKTNGAAAEEKEPETPTKGGKKGAADAAANGGGADAAQKPAKKWSAHQVELALWTHYIVNDLQPELLGGMPGNNNGVAVTNGISKDGDDEDVEGNEDVADEEEEDEENGTADDDKALADDAEDDDENSRNAVESSESESNEAAAVPAPVANGKAPVAADDAVVSSVQTNNGTSEATEQQPAADGKKEAAPTAATVESSGLATVDECTKSGDSLDGVLAVPAVAEESPVTATSATTTTTTTTTLNADDSADSQNSSSHGASKRPLYCEDSTEDKPELSAPKLIKL
ncbi:ubiquitin carboxyl-terminal hydrolase 36-like [Anopheles aquasalis]|uniref:ubiquitin carboxyl-terminal hydrolase 36-like n=1 Tax=Anopheles aquasalis TaxID=42839 RepID=UPI00215B2959|nr:ubiquitin carboxyl-terminal hydrolase 36-like [Anopheles aquasalis]XP_050089591.1 ubiquitin carboxyl-terminal hydrolase 36-like [Anopheles aquasalis]XP_050089592.1 ubiquitin carboxyl-terminal hydrolase 36-like [Anopheles aquasalis]XP_050089593.1 ubiquitin carboxyl-terminal hydrolase 36-like [Anopheles aquasalis]XP_050089594.1 ubiquitin carboxyl-terminal hydrolase 36-like [Anopheles aquasalis]